MAHNITRTQVTSNDLLAANMKASVALNDVHIMVANFAASLSHLWPNVSKWEHFCSHWAEHRFIDVFSCAQLVAKISKTEEKDGESVISVRFTPVSLLTCYIPIHIITIFIT